MKTSKHVIELTLIEKETINGGHSHVTVPEPGTCSCNPGGIGERPWWLSDGPIMLIIHEH